MNSLLYLLRKSAKNTLLEILRKPGKLIPYLLVIGLLVMAFVLPMINGAPEGQVAFADSAILKGAFFAFLTLFFAIGLQKGLTSGDTIFDMNDVNLLFVSPVDQGRILLYGIFRLAKISFLACFFLLFQGPTLQQFGIGGGGIVLLLAAAMLGVFASTILSLVIYILTNGSPRKQITVRILAVLTFVPVLLVLALSLLRTGNPLAALEAAAHSPLLAVVPIAGWLTQGAFALLYGQLLSGLGLFLLTILASVGIILYILHTKRDYYEDVLVATETAFQKKQAAAEGNLNAASGHSTRRIRVARTGVGGFGPSAFFYKHLREIFRQNRFGFFGMPDLLIGAGAIVMALFLGKGEAGNLITILQILLWIQLFLVGTGKGLLELYSHYIYLVPASPLKKLLWTNMEVVFKTMLQGVLCLVIPGVLMGLAFAPILMTWLTFVLFTLFLLGINFLTLRWTGGQFSQGILMVLYIILVLIALAPGLAAALFFGFTIGGEMGVLSGLTALCAWELLAALLLLWLSRGILHDCDIMIVKPK
jgi:hypothetical protein